MERLDFDHYFMKMAELVASRSTCIRQNRQVGAVLTVDNRVIATGYNGAVRGEQHCLDIGCARENIPSGQNVERCRAVHAELNALCQAARYGIRVEGSTMYVTLAPCNICSMAMYQSGVKRVVFKNPYAGSSGQIKGLFVEELLEVGTKGMGREVL